MSRRNHDDAGARVRVHLQPFTPYLRDNFEWALQLPSYPILKPWEHVSSPSIKIDGRQKKRMKTAIARNDADDLENLVTEAIQELHEEQQSLLQDDHCPPWWDNSLERGRVRCGSRGLPAIASDLDLINYNAELSDGMTLNLTDQWQTTRRCCSRSTGAVVRDDISPNHAAFLLPPHSASLTTNLLVSQLRLPDGFEDLLAMLPTEPFDLMMLDPPYPSHSASRLHSASLAQTASPDDTGTSAQRPRPEAYNTVKDLHDLWPLATVLKRALSHATVPREGQGSASVRAGGALVACWVTNAPRAQRFMAEKFLPACGVRVVARWAWLKVTAPAPGGEEESPCATEARSIGGVPVMQMGRTDGRKPYEVLLIGRHAASLPKCHTQDDQGHEVDSEEEEIPDLVFTAVPLGHSRKPYIVDLMRSYLPSRTQDLSPTRGPHVLELFARNLMPGPASSTHHDGLPSGIHVCVGDEPLKFNEVYGGHSGEHDDKSPARGFAGYSLRSTKCTDGAQPSLHTCGSK